MKFLLKAMVSVALVGMFGFYLRFKAELGLGGFLWGAIFAICCLMPLSILWSDIRSGRSERSARTIAQDSVPNSEIRLSRNWLITIKASSGILLILQIAGLVPALGWLKNIDAVTADMVAKLFIKIIALVVFAMVYKWADRRLQPIAISAQRDSSEMLVEPKNIEVSKKEPATSSVNPRSIPALQDDFGVYAALADRAVENIRSPAAEAQAVIDEPIDRDHLRPPINQSHKPDTSDVPREVGNSEDSGREIPKETLTLIRSLAARQNSTVPVDAGEFRSRQRKFTETSALAFVVWFVIYPDKASDGLVTAAFASLFLSLPAGMVATLIKQNNRLAYISGGFIFYILLLVGFLVYEGVAT